MRIVKPWGLLAFLLVAAGPLSADEQPKAETPPAPVKELLDGYLKAADAKDVKAMTALAAVPWLDRDRKVVRDQAGLGKAVERAAGQLPKSEGGRTVESFPYKKLRERIKDDAERKLFDEVLGEDGWLTFVEEDGYPLSLRTVLIRVKDGKAAVAGGPLKQNQVWPQNRIPEAVDHLFEKAGTFELFSLDPEQKFDKEGKIVPVKDGFHGWEVLGKVEVKEADRKRLADALRLGAEDNFGMVAACFIPRHGIRLKDGDRTIDLVICFQCLSIQVFENGQRKDGFLTTSESQKAFDAVLTAAGIKLPKQARD